MSTTSHVKLKDKQFPTDHISSFHTVEPHHCRHDTKKKYMNSELGVSKMSNLYGDKCFMDENPREPIKAHLYGSLFDFSFNYGIFRPINDLCDTREKLPRK